MQRPGEITLKWGSGVNVREGGEVRGVVEAAHREPWGPRDGPQIPYLPPSSPTHYRLPGGSRR